MFVYDEWFELEGGGEYLEKSGMLKALQRRMKSDEAAQKAWLAYWAEQILAKPEFASTRDWSAELIRRYEKGELKVGKYDDGPTGVMVPHREVPDWLNAREVYLHKDKSGRAECLVLAWSSYGLVVSPTNHVCTLEASYMTNLLPGVQAYHRGALD